MYGRQKRIMGAGIRAVSGGRWAKMGALVASFGVAPAAHRSRRWRNGVSFKLHYCDKIQGPIQNS